MAGHVGSAVCGLWLALGLWTAAAAQQPSRADAIPAERPPATAAILENTSRLPHTVEASLTAAPARLSLVPGRLTDAYAYNGQVPGPTLDVREGDRVIIHFRNLLPEPTTIHWHGLHIPATSDGSPFMPIAPGDTHDYTFTLLPGSAGTYWYHPHPHHHTGAQVARGLYGSIVVRVADDPLRGLPERLLVLSDNRFDPDGRIDLPDLETPQGRLDAENGREGDVLFVSGEVGPTYQIRSGEVQRWRIVNASAARVYRLALPGHTLLQVGSDGGLFEHPVAIDQLTLANGERAEILVRGTAAPGTRATMTVLPYDRYVPQTRPEGWSRERPLLTLQYSGEEPALPPPLPSVLRAVAPLDPADATATRLVVLTQGLINGRTMDMARSDFTARLGATEVWEVENLVGMDHPFHLHGFQFQVLDRDGTPEPFRSWKDTVNVPKHQTVRLIVRYEDYPGKWMFHCHILTHEDAGMMGVLEVR